MAHILLVDDDLDVTRVLVCLLHHAGHEASAVGSGDGALEHVKQAVPDLILLDYMMPEMDGIEVMKRLRSRAETAACPIIMYTAVQDDGFASFARSCGADDVWVKGSISFDEVERKIQARTLH